MRGHQNRPRHSRRSFRATHGSNRLPPPLFVVEITCTEREPDAKERSRGREWDRIERRRWKIDNSVLVCPRRLFDITAASRSTKPFRKIFETFRQIGIGAWHAVTAADDVRSQGCQFSGRRACRLPVNYEWRRRARELAPSCQESAPRIHIDGRKSVASPKHTIRIPEESNATPRMSAR